MKSGKSDKSALTNWFHLELTGVKMVLGRSRLEVEDKFIKNSMNVANKGLHSRKGKPEFTRKLLHSKQL